jgi:hypothetical protein
MNKYDNAHGGSYQRSELPVSIKARKADEVSGRVNSWKHSGLTLTIDHHVANIPNLKPGEVERLNRTGTTYCTGSLQ